MSWRRGLFRLWIVATVLWLVFAGYVTDLGQEASNYINREKVLTADTPSDLEKVCSKVPDRAIDYDCLFGLTTRTSTTAKQEREYFASVVESFLVLGAAAPAGVLVLGVALYWVFAGFVGNSRRWR